MKGGRIKKASTPLPTRMEDDEIEMKASKTRGTHRETKKENETKKRTCET